MLTLSALFRTGGPCRLYARTLWRFLGRRAEFLQFTGKSVDQAEIGPDRLPVCEEAGGIWVDVPTRKVKPSQTCPVCGHQEKKELSQRVHLCSECGHTEGRDTAAARVMLNWAERELAAA